MPWDPTTSVVETWGRLRLVFNDVDVTFYKGIPTQIGEWSSTEPFDDARLVVTFPQITPFLPLPAWAADWADVDLELVRPDGSRKILWEGFFDNEEDSVSSDGSGITFECLGALYQLDLYDAQPALAISLTPTDVGALIAAELDPGRRPALRTLPLAPVATGITTFQTGGWDPALTGFVAGLLSKSTLADGSNQWTLAKETGRRPVLRLKDRTTVHWTVHVGAPGVTEALTRDLVMAPNAIYGEGIDNEQCRWRGAKYPNIRVDDAPVFDGVIIHPGNTRATMATFSRELFERGWTSFVVDNFYAPAEASLVRAFQAQAGLQVDGDIGPQTWAAAFQVGSNGGDLTDAYFAPLAWDPRTEPYVYGPSGAIIGPNPLFDRSVVRVERKINFGSRISKDEATALAAAEMARDYPPGYAGTVTLATDPQEGSRWEVRSGHNLLLRGHKGTNRLLHIAEATLDFFGGTATLRVDEKARDLESLASAHERERENTDPARRKQRTYRNSRATEDRRATWDCENGAGIIPRHGIYAGLWNVLRIPCAQAGTIVRAEFTVDTPARFAVAVFDRPTYHSQLRAVAPNPLIPGFWDVWPEDTGLVIAWGGDGEAAGYYPGRESNTNPLTGRLVDNATWYFESTQPPYLWVALWCESPTINYISGRFFAGVD